MVVRSYVQNGRGPQPRTPADRLEGKGEGLKTPRPAKPSLFLRRGMYRRSQSSPSTCSIASASLSESDDAGLARGDTFAVHIFPKVPGGPAIAVIIPIDDAKNRLEGFVVIGRIADELTDCDQRFELGQVDQLGGP